MTVPKRGGLVKYGVRPGGTSPAKGRTSSPDPIKLGQPTARDRARSTPSPVRGTPGGAASVAASRNGRPPATVPKGPIPGAERLRRQKESNPMSKRQPRDIVCPRCGVPSAKVIGRSESQPVIYLRCEDCGRTSIAPE